MIVTFLGTGTSHGVPVIGCDCVVCSSLDFRDKRLRTSVHIEIEGKSFVFDSGPDFRTQMLRERIKHLTALIFTHEHKDHTAGLDDIRPYNYKQNRNIPVYGRKNVLNSLKNEFPYAFAEVKYPGIPQLDLYEIENKPFIVEGIEIIPIEVLHYMLPVFGYRIKDFTYITDAKTISDPELEKIKGSKLLVINALQKTDHISHFNLDEAIKIIDQVKPDQAYITHISHNMGLHKEVEHDLPDNVKLGYDGLRIELME